MMPPAPSFVQFDVPREHNGRQQLKAMTSPVRKSVQRTTDLMNKARIKIGSITSLLVTADASMTVTLGGNSARDAATREARKGRSGSKRKDDRGGKDDVELDVEVAKKKTNSLIEDLNVGLKNCKLSLRGEKEKKPIQSEPAEDEKRCLPVVEKQRKLKPKEEKMVASGALPYEFGNNPQRMVDDLAHRFKTQRKYMLTEDPKFSGTSCPQYGYMGTQIPDHSRIQKKLKSATYYLDPKGCAESTFVVKHKHNYLKKNASEPMLRKSVLDERVADIDEKIQLYEAREEAAFRQRCINFDFSVSFKNDKTQLRKLRRLESLLAGSKKDRKKKGAPFYKLTPASYAFTSWSKTVVLLRFTQILHERFLVKKEELKNKPEEPRREIAYSTTGVLLNHSQNKWHSLDPKERSVHQFRVVVQCMIFVAKMRALHRSKHTSSAKQSS